MLIDELLAAPHIDPIPPSHLGIFHNRLRKAVKFELAPDFAVASETLASDFQAASKALPFCRLPFSSVWIEVAQAVRPRFSAAEVHLPLIQSIPKRVGFLLEALDKDQKTFKAHQFWSFPDRPVKNASISAMIFDPSKMREDDPLSLIEGNNRKYIKVDSHPKWKTASPEARSRLITTINPSAPDFPMTQFIKFSGLDATDLSPDEFADMVFEIAICDWSGEAMFMLAVLALLNTVNAHERVAVDLTKLNKSRIKRGDIPLQDYYTLKISSRLKSKMYIKSDSDGHRELRLHMVRGHFKVRKSGIYFWHPHFRGDKSKGLVEKDYELT